MIALASLTQQGNPFTKSLPTLAAVSSRWLKEYLRRMERGIISSKPTGEALDVGLFSMELAADIKDYDEAKSLDKVMEKLGEDAIEDVQAYVTVIAGIAKALATGAALGMILFVYAGIVFLVLSLSTPGALPL